MIIFSNSLLFFEEIVLDILNEFCSKNRYFKIKLITKNKINFTKYPNLKFINNEISSYNFKIFLQTDNENNNNRELKFFKNINASKSSLIPCSLTGEITQKRFIRAFKTIWYSRIYYLFEPNLIIKLLIKLIKNK